MAQISPSHGFREKTKYPGWTGGGQAVVTIDWVGIFSQDQANSKDNHRGWSGNSKRNTVYYLLRPTFKKGLQYFIKSRLKGGTEKRFAWRHPLAEGKIIVDKVSRGGSHR